MVTAEVDDISQQFEDVIENRDIVGAATLGIAGAGGGALAQQIAGVILPRAGFSARPSNATGLVVSGSTKILLGAVHAVIGTQIGGTVGTVLGLAGLGAAIVGGGDFINALLGATGTGGGGSVPQGSTRPVTNGANAGSVSTAQSTNGSAATAAGGGSGDGRLR
jgi:hypothetical protein